MRDAKGSLSTAPSAWPGTPWPSSSAIPGPGSSASTATPCPSRSPGRGSAPTPRGSPLPRDFRELADLDIPYDRVRGILLDLGYVLSARLAGARLQLHLRRALDMRMDTRMKTTAAKILHTYAEPKLAEVFARYGELARPGGWPGRSPTCASSPPRDDFRPEGPCRADLPVAPAEGPDHPAAKAFQASASRSTGSSRGSRVHRRDRPADPSGDALRRHLLPLARGPHRQARLPRPGPP